MVYSKWLKHIPIIDIVLLSQGYILRIIYGACIVNVSVSEWLYLTILSASFCFGFGKRRNEIRNVNSDIYQTRKVLNSYTETFLDRNMYLFMAIADVFYALWTITKHNKILFWSVPLVMILFLKYSFDIESKTSSGDPVEVFMSDKALIVLLCLYVIVVIISLYVI